MTMFRAVQKAARNERNTHPYRNRTGNLERSTQGILLEQSLTQVVAELEMGMYYADAVNEKGYSNIDDVAEVCEREILRALTP